ncbi:hypothetical protein [Nocardia fluminea]|uniref:Uncharacterized protein n=1 Tax=Nocardia fluminea TaxID=134984 RepID=A0A2N3VGY0_9NOCA|nr:hypothetical protein [Nocardia fluminea]PKV80866.1 hypothetical protein ATK86_5303 [Nocardia fluminea]
MTAPRPTDLKAATEIVTAAIRSRCAVVLVRLDLDDPELLHAEEIHNDRIVSDAELAQALRALADRIDDRSDPRKGGVIS